MLYYKSKLKTYSYFFIERSNMGKKKKLPPKMEQIKEREKEPWMIKEGVSAKVTPLSRLWNREGLCGLLQDENRRGEDMNSLSHDSYRRQEA